MYECSKIVAFIALAASVNETRGSIVPFGKSIVHAAALPLCADCSSRGFKAIDVVLRSSFSDGSPNPTVGQQVYSEVLCFLYEQTSSNKHYIHVSSLDRVRI